MQIPVVSVVAHCLVMSAVRYSDPISKHTYHNQFTCQALYYMSQRSELPWTLDGVLSQL